MRALVTGFNARTASPTRASRDLTFSSLLVRALRDLGWQVEHGDRPVQDPVEEIFDRVFIGLSSPVALSSNRTYTALAAIGRAWPAGKAIFFLDDPDVRKITNSLDSVALRNPASMFKPLFERRLSYSTVAEDQPWQQYMLSVIEALRTRPWPSTLVPAYAWADPAQLTVRLPECSRDAVRSMDLTWAVPYEESDPAENSHGMHWVTEEDFDSAWLNRQHVQRPVKQLVKMTDPKRIEEYRAAAGVLANDASPYGPGWFDARTHLALAQGALWSGQWESWIKVGDPFTALPHKLESLSQSARVEAVLAQRAALADKTWDRTTARAALRSIAAVPDPTGVPTP